VQYNIHVDRRYYRQLVCGGSPETTNTWMQSALLAQYILQHVALGVHFLEAYVVTLPLMNNFRQKEGCYFLMQAMLTAVCLFRFIFVLTRFPYRLYFNHTCAMNPTPFPFTTAYDILLLSTISVDTCYNCGIWNRRHRG